MKDKFSSGASPLERYSKPVILGSLLGITALFLCLIFMAFVFSLFSLSTGGIPIASSVSIGIGAFLGGLIAAKKSGKRGLLIGSLVGFIMFLVFLLISLAVIKTAPTSLTLIKMIIYISAAAIGGIMGVKNNNKRKII